LRLYRHIRFDAAHSGLFGVRIPLFWFTFHLFGLYYIFVLVLLLPLLIYGQFLVLFCHLIRFYQSWSLLIKWISEFENPYRQYLQMDCSVALGFLSHTLNLLILLANEKTLRLK
jgi:Flp pilus assembly protein TadB